MARIINLKRQTQSRYREPVVLAGWGFLAFYVSLRPVLLFSRAPLGAEWFSAARSALGVFFGGYLFLEIFSRPGSHVMSPVDSVPSISLVTGLCVPRIRT